MSKPCLKAVVDLGSNTFHLLIARVYEDGYFEKLCRLRRFVALAEEGVEHIGDAAFERGIAALREFVMLFQKEGIAEEDVLVLGTAALRSADNSADFLKKVKEETGLSVKIIDGNEEARLIAVGVRAAVPFGKSPHLIMDIGGGSVEFITANEEEDFWVGSFPVGILVLYHRLQPDDPLSPQKLNELRQWLAEKLKPLAEALKKHPVNTLVGASGSFDVLEAMKAEARTEKQYLRIPATDFEQMFDKLLPTTLEERLQMPCIPNNRAKLVVMAFGLIDYVLHLSNVKEIVVSDYAMKEGALLAYMCESK